MTPQSLQIRIDGVAYEAIYREVGYSVEVEWNGIRRTLPIGSVRSDVAAANGLRTMVRRERPARGPSVSSGGE